MNFSPVFPGMLMALGTAIAVNLMQPPSVSAAPLEIGKTYAVGSRYASLSQSGDRLCYTLATATNQYTSSVRPHDVIPDLYIVEGSLLTATETTDVEPAPPLLLYQETADILRIGDIIRMIGYEYVPGFAAQMDEDVRACLDSDEPFLLESSTGR